MSKQFQRGLIVGKFSPLHRGHELVVNRAFERCDEVAIISYSNPEFPGCEAEKREKWLAASFPKARCLVVTHERLRMILKNAPIHEIPPNDADDPTHRRFVGFLCTQIEFRPDAVFTSEDYGDGFARALTSYFRQYAAGTSAVQHVLVDKERTRIPISGTALRNDIHGHRQWLSPVVYASFVRRVCLLGGESSGKSTLAEALAKTFHTVHVPEYGRELWERRNGQLSYDDLLHIGERQVADEEEALFRANRFLFCDTSPLTTLFYCEHLFGSAEPGLHELANRAYDLVVLCGTDFAFVQDGTRQQPKFRDLQHAWYLAEFERRRTPFVLATGSVSDRIAQISNVLLNSFNRPRLTPSVNTEH